MDKSDKIDKTKENIGVSELDEHTRKRLFDKFVNAGGEVVSDRQKRKALIIDRDSQRRFQSKLDGHKQNQEVSRNRRQPRTYQPAYSSGGKRESLGFTELIQNLKLRLKLRFMRISRYHGLYFNIKFLERFNNIYKPALMELQVIYLNLFKKDLKTGNRIITRLDNIRPLYYELIEAIGNIYDKMSTDQIVDHYRNFPDVPKKVFELKEPILDLFKKIYLLRTYENISIEAMSSAVDFYIKIKDKGDGIDSSTRKKIRHDLFIIYHKLYPRLHWLFCYYYGIYLPYDDEEVEDFLAIDESERFGKRMLASMYDTQPEGFPILEQEDAEGEPGDENAAEKTGQSNELPDPVQRGLELMYKLDLRALREKYDKDELFARVSDTDKVLITYLLFSEFDHEYSFILTTNKIKFNPDFIRRGEYNYKTKMNDLYDEMRKSHEALKNYAHELAHYEKARKERPVGNTQYIEYTKRLESINKKRSISGKIARMTVKLYMEKIAEEMRILINDLTDGQKLISNPQDVLDFNTAIEGERKINGLKIYEAITLAYNFSSAFSYRLQEGGELSGAGDDTAESDTQQETPDAQASPETKDEKESKTDKKSILEELDDML